MEPTKKSLCAVCTHLQQKETWNKNVPLLNFKKATTWAYGP